MTHVALVLLIVAEQWKRTVDLQLRGVSDSTRYLHDNTGLRDAVSVIMYAIIMAEQKSCAVGLKHQSVLTPARLLLDGPTLRDFAYVGLGLFCSVVAVLELDVVDGVNVGVGAGAAVGQLADPALPQEDATPDTDAVGTNLGQAGVGSWRSAGALAVLCRGGVVLVVFFNTIYFCIWFI